VAPKAEAPPPEFIIRFKNPDGSVASTMILGGGKPPEEFDEGEAGVERDGPK
jgi:hypothetical protein